MSRLGLLGALACAAVLWAAGCGPEAALWVRIEAPLRVPEDCDALELRVIRLEGAVESVAYGRLYSLSEGPQFPLTVALTAGRSFDLERPLTVSARALLGDSLAKPWAATTASVQLSSGRTVELTLELCDCSR